MKRGFKGGRRKGKGKGGKGSGGRRFFKKSKGRSNLADDQKDAWQTEGQWQDSQWQDQSWDDWSWYESEEAYAAKGKGKKGKKCKGKGKMERKERTGSPAPRMEQPSLQMLPRAVPQLLQSSTLTT